MEKKNKVLHTICQQIWKTSRDHRTEKGQSSSQFPRRAILKNVQTSRQLGSSPMLVRLCSKFSKLGFSITWIENFQMFKLALERVEEPEIKLPAFPGSWRKQGNSRKKKKKIYLYFIDYAKAFDSADHNKLWKTLKEMEIQDHLTCLLRNFFFFCNFNFIFF